MKISKTRLLAVALIQLACMSPIKLVPKNTTEKPPEFAHSIQFDRLNISIKSDQGNSNLPTVCIEGAIFDEIIGLCRCKRLTHYQEEVEGVAYCRRCKDGPKFSPDRLSCSFCTFESNLTTKKQICLTEPVGFLASDDLEMPDRFVFGPACLGYSSQEVLFIVPTKYGWAEISQSNKINQPLTLKLNNKAP